MTFYYTNQQSARLLFYHDHAWGITRLNVYAGEAAGYVITDATEQALFGPTGPYAVWVKASPWSSRTAPSFPILPSSLQPIQPGTASRWGGYGNFWYHHVYMSAQNPGDPGGMSAYGRWMYGPWFWPPATPMYGTDCQPVLQHGPRNGLYHPIGSTMQPRRSSHLAVPDRPVLRASIYPRHA